MRVPHGFTHNEPVGSPGAVGSGVVSVRGNPAVFASLLLLQHVVDPNSPVHELVLAVGCTVSVHTPAPIGAVMQVAPAPATGLTIRREEWGTAARHHTYVDRYGNRCERFAIEPGETDLVYDAVVECSPDPDVIVTDAGEVPAIELADDLLHFVMPSRFCLPDELGLEAWQRFGDMTPGWPRVQAIVDFVHGHLEFAHGSSNPWTTAADVYRSRQGVCRDFAHLAITFCRALNIPARYVFGYIPDIDAVVSHEPMDFCAWFEANLDGRWYTFDARINAPRVGRVVVGRGRDAVDVALLTSFGPLTLTDFQVRSTPVP
jgi:transglutaminase-like putative cysteine protease